VRHEPAAGYAAERLGVKARAAIVAWALELPMAIDDLADGAVVPPLPLPMLAIRESDGDGAIANRWQGRRTASDYTKPSFFLTQFYVRLECNRRVVHNVARRARGLRRSFW
jgi:hypothetical protein